MEAKIYINDKLAEKWRELAMKRFGYGRGSISKAAEEALSMWVENEEIIVATLENLKKIASKQKQVFALLLFGSYARKEPYHDIDITVIVHNKSNKLKILSLFESSVPETPKFDFSIFNDMPINMKSRVLSECMLIYEKQGFDLKKLSSELIQKWSDIKPMIDAAVV
jgi:predicted nucleotidyltransferase